MNENVFDSTDPSWASTAGFTPRWAAYYLANPSPCEVCGLDMSAHPEEFDDDYDHAYEFKSGEEPFIVDLPNPRVRHRT